MNTEARYTEDKITIRSIGTCYRLFRDGELVGVYAEKAELDAAKRLAVAVADAPQPIFSDADRAELANARWTDIDGRR